MMDLCADCNEMLFGEPTDERQPGEPCSRCRQVKGREEE